MIENVRISESAKRHLVAAKRATGIDQWNILCRWAFCLSTTSNRPLIQEDSEHLSNVEMTWRTFAGSQENIYWSLLLSSYNDRLDGEGQLSLPAFLRLHIERGAADLSKILKSSGLSGLFRLPLENE